MVMIVECCFALLNAWLLMSRRLMKQTRVFGPVLETFCRVRAGFILSSGVLALLPLRFLPVRLV